MITSSHFSFNWHFRPLSVDSTVTCSCRCRNVVYYCVYLLPLLSKNYLRSKYFNKSKINLTRRFLFGKWGSKYIQNIGRCDLRSCNIHNNSYTRRGVSFVEILVPTTTRRCWRNVRLLQGSQRYIEIPN